MRRLRARAYNLSERRAADMAQQYPHARVVGFDLVPGCPACVAPSLTRTLPPLMHPDPSAPHRATARECKQDAGTGGANAA